MQLPPDIRAEMLGCWAQMLAAQCFKQTNSLAWILKQKENDLNKEIARQDLKKEVLNLILLVIL